jgi:threonine/homoserine/homoserine lactone efflux protein
MVESLRTWLAQFVIYCMVAVMSICLLIYCWFAWRHERRKRIKATIARWFEAIALLIFGGLDEEEIAAGLTIELTDQSWR